ncbi:MAG: DUF4185 domain-containing protein [Proteiniphilum sp.]|jgi:hypothetical protein|uniref:DUF4185 domain-containing protein n=1 Tax=Proteiniphilum sp. TaxID=1926877 RepID=UPI002B1FDD38|nr:DUF4185 domain-containing protein [Proteiniphilum sp.]MEA5129603.1 DUF4185 domain-containing protein [Proteiniphilum sp.]
MEKKYFIIYFSVFLLLLGCSDGSLDPNPEESESEETVVTGDIPATIPSDITIVQHATKISQLTGDYDKHLNELTLSQAYSRYKIEGTDLGVPFEDGDTTWLLFGDTWGPQHGYHDIIGYTTDKNPEDGLKLDFVTDDEGTYQGIIIPGVNTTGVFEVPTEGIVIDNQFYIWMTTDHSDKVTMGRSVLATANRTNALKGLYSKVYDLSVSKFINVSVVRVKNMNWNFLPSHEGEGLVIFGSGSYRKSLIYLAWLPISEIKNRNSIQYFAGVKDGKPLWTGKEKYAQPIFRLTDPGVGELSASYNKFIKKWILLYNHGEPEPRGINMRTSDTPWGSWSETQVIFEPWADGGYCNFMHTSWENRQCDNVHNTGRENEWGGEYGPYQFEHFATGDDYSTTIYFTMSTWNPYDVMLMKASLKKK